MAEANDALSPTQTSTQPILETIPLEHLPASHSVHVAVFKDVKNAAFLHQQLLSRNVAFEYALIDASVITSQIQVLSAVFKAVTTQTASVMKTPNVHSEIVYSLSPANNISEAYRRHGITPTSQNLIIVKVLVSPSSSVDAPSEVKVPSTPSEVESHLLAHVEGTCHPFTDSVLQSMTDHSKIRKYYKLNGMGWLDGIKDEDAKRHETEMLIIGGIALRGV
ncbi:kinase binding protein CGI-121-domain-containing protein [Xylariaceae sp. FL1272]|nr:kinase binding protein CGI-121-domain-containing protein [Xylariaceae sp. FL1272]